MLGFSTIQRLNARLFGVLAACAMAAALAPASAGANVTGYWNGDSGGTGLDGRHADATRTVLTASYASTSDGPYEVWAGAHYAGGNTLYASWATGTGSACHTYGSSNVGAMFETPYTRMNIIANAGWQGDLGSWYC